MIKIRVYGTSLKKISRSLRSRARRLFPEFKRTFRAALVMAEGTATLNIKGNDSIEHGVLFQNVGHEVEIMTPEKMVGWVTAPIKPGYYVEFGTGERGERGGCPFTGDRGFLAIPVISQQRKKSLIRSANRAGVTQSRVYRGGIKKTVNASAIKVGDTVIIPYSRGQKAAPFMRPLFKSEPPKIKRMFENALRRVVLRGR